MSVLHFLNVNQGDCSIIEHNNDHHVTVVDVCNARHVGPLVKFDEAAGVRGNFGQKDNPDNPIDYMRQRGIKDIFRFVLTHPDMDHMDGIKDLFEAFPPTNFWDTDNKKEMGSFDGTRYREEDWLFYKKLRDGNTTDGPKRLALHSGSEGKYYNENEDGTPGGDGLNILAPTKQLVRAANSDEDFNDGGYVLLYRTGGDLKVLLAGDSHDETWEHILKTWPKAVANVDVLIAPHHGRDSGRSFDFLNHVKPRVTFFGNASSEHLAYGAWSSRNLRVITNNQAGAIVAELEDGWVHLYVTNPSFAAKESARLGVTSFYSPKYKAHYLGCIMGAAKAAA